MRARWFIIFLPTALFISEALARPLGALRRLTEQERAIIVQAIEPVLKDPDAAKFRWFPYNGFEHYCGQINGKNSYGGYIGYSHYIVDVQKDEAGRIVSASKPNIIGPDDPIGSVMRSVCEISAKADTEDKTVAPAEP